MKDALINLLAIVLLICGGLFFIAGCLVGKPQWFGRCLVRGKHLMLRLLGERA